MTTSRYNRNRRRKFRAVKVAESRRERRIGGNYAHWGSRRFDGRRRHDYNRQVDTWYQSKERR